MQSRPINHPQKGPATERIRAEGTGGNPRVKAPELEDDKSKKHTRCGISKPS